MSHLGKYMSLLSVVMLLAAACSGEGPGLEDLEAERDQLLTANDELSIRHERSLGEVQTLQQRIQELESELASAGELESRLQETMEANDALEGRVSEAERESVALRSEVEDLRFAFDSEIADARNAFAAELTSTICSAQRTDYGGISIEDHAASLISANPEYQVALAGFDLSHLVDLDQLSAVRDDCLAEARLKAPKGDGFFTVGVEIAAGTWRSQGTQDDCYWARLDRNQGILDNHFGRAGGSVTIRSSDYEVQFEDCGSWIYVDD